MFSNYNAYERRKSMSNLVTNDKWRPRSSSMGVIEINSPENKFYCQRGPATPCFVSPRMAFSTAFNYDSPIQVLTSSSPGLFTPMSVSKLKRNYSMRKMSLKGKLLLTISLLSLALCLNIAWRFSRGKTVDCSVPGSCDGESHKHTSLQRFVRAVRGPGPDHHTLTGDLDNPEIQVQGGQYNYEETVWPNENPLDDSFKQKNIVKGNRIPIIVGSSVELSDEDLGNAIPVPSEESTRNLDLEDGDLASIQSSPLSRLPPAVPAGKKDLWEGNPQGLNRPLIRVPNQENGHPDVMAPHKQGSPLQLQAAPQNGHQLERIPNPLQNGYPLVRVPHLQGNGHQLLQAPYTDRGNYHPESNMAGQLPQNFGTYEDNLHFQEHEKSMAGFSVEHTEYNKPRNGFGKLRLDRLPPGVNPRIYL